VPPAPPFCVPPFCVPPAPPFCVPPLGTPPPPSCVPPSDVRTSDTAESDEQPKTTGATTTRIARLRSIGALRRGVQETSPNPLPTLRRGTKGNLSSESQRPLRCLTAGTSITPGRRRPSRA